MFGGVFNKKEKAEYEAAVKQMELQQMQHQMQMQKEIQKYQAGPQTRPGLIPGSIHTGSIGSITQAQMAAQGVVGDSGSTILRNMQDDIRGLRVSIEHLNGFYKWIIHAYPETLVQYKALKDLEAASRGQDESEQYQAKSAI
jgi:hypothetical protein